MQIEIKNTKDYSQFVTRERTSKRLVNELMKEVMRDNYLPYCPIVVSKDMYILDGHKRYEVSKELEQPIYFVVREDISCGGKPKETITEVEKPKVSIKYNESWYEKWYNKWDDCDIQTTFLLQKNNPNYTRLAEFVDRLGFSHNKGVLRKCFIIFTSLDFDQYKDFKEGNIVENDFCWMAILKILQISGLTLENAKENTMTDNMLGGTIQFLKAHSKCSIERIGEWWKTAKPTLVQKCGVSNVAHLSWEKVRVLMEKELL